VLEQIDVPDDVEIIGIVVNEKGSQRAIASKAVSTLGFPCSVSETFLRNNQNQTVEECYKVMELVKREADAAGRNIVVYISMAFGNPYGDPWDAEEIVNAVDVLESSGIKIISLADTVGGASAEQIQSLVAAVLSRFGYLEIGVHLHSRPEQAGEKILAAYDAGCRRFDSVIGGLGGCPFAQDALVGNLATETLIETLKQRRAELPSLKSLDTLLRASAEIGARYAVSHVDD